MRVAVCGAGLMGHALALVHALGGHTVRLTDTNAETLARAPKLMATALATLREGGEVDGSWTDSRLAGAVKCCATPAETLEAADAAERRRAMSAAKVQIGRSGKQIGQEAVQLHGGIAMTMEYKVGHYFKRMTMIDMLFGDADWHLAAVAELGSVF